MKVPARPARRPAFRKARARTDVVLANLALISGYAHVLTLDNARAHAVLRETLYLEVFGRVADNWLADKLTALRSLRSVFFAYHSWGEPQRGAASGPLLEGDGRWKTATTLSRALAALEIADRELLFLRHSALLSDTQIEDLTGRDRSELAGRIAQLGRIFPFAEAMRRAQRAIEPIGLGDLASIHTHLGCEEDRRPTRRPSRRPSSTARGARAPA